MKTVTKSRNERIVLGGGCFWCVEAGYTRIEGVVETRPGYSGGKTERPVYDQVCSGNTGHAEVVEVVFDPSKITLQAILEIFWHVHDPTTLNCQGNDVGSQYRSAIFYTDEAQKAVIEASLSRLTASGLYKDPPVTQVQVLDMFWPAEDYHKDYFENNRHQGYCRIVIEPKLKKLALLKT